VAVLGGLVLVGICVISLVLIRESTLRLRDARNAIDVVTVSDAGFDLLTALQREQGLMIVSIATGDEQDIERADSQYPDTDQALDRYSLLIGDLNASINADSEPTQLNLDSLTQARSAAGTPGADPAATLELYHGFFDEIERRLSELAFLAKDADELRLRRASLLLVSAADALSQRRTLVVSVAASGSNVEAATQLQISLYSREYAVDIGAAADLLVGDDLRHVLALSTSPTATAVNDAVGTLVAEGSGSTTAAIHDWFSLAGQQMEETMTVASELNTKIGDQAESRTSSARRSTLVMAGTAVVFFALALAVTWSAIAASRGRVRALADHRRLVDGLLHWFETESLPDVDGLDIETRYVPAAVSGAGGDWYDVFRDSGGRIAIVIGDVAGHGADTVAAMAEMRNMLRAFAHTTESGPAHQLELLDDSLGPEQLTTVFYAVLDGENGTLTYSRAGHVPGVLRRRDGITEILYKGSDSPLGVGAGRSRVENVEPFEQGDTLILFTDGLIEQPGEDVLDAIRSMAEGVIAEAADGLGELADQLLASRPALKNLDDASIVIVRLAELTEV
jgi:hypothetical protein